MSHEGCDDAKNKPFHCTPASVFLEKHIITLSRFVCHQSACVSRATCPVFIQEIAVFGGIMVRGPGSPRISA